MRISLKMSAIATCLILSLSQNLAHAATTPPPYKVSLEKKLHRLGIPTGKIDGIFDGQTRRALCVWRELTEANVNRNLPANSEYNEIQSTDILFPSNELIAGLNINLTCQSAIWLQYETSTPLTIFKISSGRPTLETTPGTYSIGWSIDDWYESRRYPDGWMYRPLFFYNGQALHGSESDSMVHSYPASHGCVRMMQADIDTLWSAGFGKGSTVHVYGKWIG